MQIVHEIVVMFQKMCIRDRNHWMYSGIRSDQVSVRNREIADRQDACDGWINDEYKSS